MSVLDDFVAAHDGQYLEVEDPSALDQCMDLADGWCDALHIDRGEIRNYAAYMVCGNHGPHLVPTDSPQRGDIVIWDQRIGSAGHIAVLLDGNPWTGEFDSFDQNWPAGSPCHVQHHDSVGVSCVLHPTVLDAPPAPRPPAAVTADDET